MHLYTYIYIHIHIHTYTYMYTYITQTNNNNNTNQNQHRNWFNSNWLHPILPGQGWAPHQPKQGRMHIPTHKSAQPQNSSRQTFALVLKHAHTFVYILDLYSSYIHLLVRTHLPLTHVRPGMHALEVYISCWLCKLVLGSLTTQPGRHACTSQHTIHAATKLPSRQTFTFASKHAHTFLCIPGAYVHLGYI